MKKTLVAYFSATGVTKAAAEALAAAADADLYEIQPAVPYTDADLNWQNKKSRSSVEMSDKSSRPALAQTPPDVSGYDTIFLGFPVWWYIAPTIVNTYLEGCKLDGKRIILFATSGGSGFGDTVQHLQTSAPGAVITEGKILNGRPSVDTLKAWVESL